jgi:phosphonate transport system ATP-binding protein
MDILADMNARDRITILVSLHQVEYGVKYCPRTIALKAGEVVYDGPSCELTPELLNSIYGAESSDLFLPALDPPRISVRGVDGAASSIRHPAPQRLQQVSAAAV